MRWPWSKIEKRESGGDFSDAIVRLLESQAAGTAADASSTAAVEAASGALSRAFASATVEGESWVQETVTPSFLAQCGRDLIRSGDSMHVLRVGSRRRGATDSVLLKLALGRLSRSVDSWTVPSDCLRAKHLKHDMEPASVVRCFRSLGIYTRATLCRDGSALVGTHDRTTSI